MTSTPSLLNTSSNAAVNFESRSRSRNLPAERRPGPSRPGCALLDHPLRSRVVGAAGEMNSAAAHLYKEEDVEPGQLDRVHGEEVRGQDLVGVLAHELPPGALASPRCWLQAMAAEHFCGR